MPPVEVQQKKPKPVKRPALNQAPAEAAEHERHDAQPSLAAAPASSTTLTGEAIAAQKPVTNDTASLLSNVPGVSLYQGAAFPACPQSTGHGGRPGQNRAPTGCSLQRLAATNMNPVLSYADPSAVAQVKVMAGITPVSAGGDSIGGTILVESAAPRFAAPGGDLLTYGYASAFARNNGGVVATSGSASAATENVNITYTGAWSRSNDYKDGNGHIVDLTLDEAGNHSLSLAVRDNSNLLVIQGGVQHIPYEGFPNEYMDMTGNDAWFVNTHYQGRFDWEARPARLLPGHAARNELHRCQAKRHRHREHAHGYAWPEFRLFGEGRNTAVPARYAACGQRTPRLPLDDWWPAIAMGGMMTPAACAQHLLEHPQRPALRFGTFVEWERKWDRHGRPWWACATTPCGWIPAMSRAIPYQLYGTRFTHGCRRLQRQESFAHRLELRRNRARPLRARSGEHL